VDFSRHAQGLGLVRVQLLGDRQDRLVADAKRARTSC
jgi:hypothetical protein